MNYTIEQLTAEMQRLNYTVFTNGDFNINTVAVRSNLNQNNDKVQNLFLDKLFIFYKIKSEWFIKSYECTTIPGLTYFNQPYNPSYGTAIVVPGQYKSSHSLGFHYSYPGLIQTGLISCYRDINKDSVINLDAHSIQTGFYGINIHYAMDGVLNINNFSAGCTVLNNGQLSDKYKQFLWHYQNAITMGQANSFTYTLLNEF